MREWNTRTKRAAIDTRKVTSGDLFATGDFPQVLKNNYLYRMAGAIFGISELRGRGCILSITVDSVGGNSTPPTIGTVWLQPREVPPVNAFRSLTMYDLPAKPPDGESAH